MAFIRHQSKLELTKLLREPLINGVFLSEHIGYSTLATTRKNRAEYDHDFDAVMAKIDLNQTFPGERNRVCGT